MNLVKLGQVLDVTAAEQRESDVHEEEVSFMSVGEEYWRLWR